MNDIQLAVALGIERRTSISEAHYQRLGFLEYNRCFSKWSGEKILDLL